MKKERKGKIAAAYLFLVKDGKTLLMRRFNTGHEDGNYSMVAGHLEEGESFADCIVRETKEEVGILIKKKDLKVVHVMHQARPNDSVGGRIDVFFTTNKWQGQITNKEPHKCDDLSWFDLDKLPENIIFYIKKVIEKIADENYFSEREEF